MSAKNNRAYLSKMNSDRTQQKWVLNQDEFVIGRNDSADITLKSNQISRTHAKVIYKNGNYYIIDLNSRNGTFVDGKRVIDSPHWLNKDCEIVLGGTEVLGFYDPNKTGLLPLGISIDRKRRKVWVDACALEPGLSHAQFNLLQYLYESPDQIVTQSQIIQAVWPHDNPAGISKDAIKGLVSRLRGRLREVQPNREYIEIVRGHGIRLKVF